MPDEKKPQTIAEEAGLPENWVPIDVPPIIPGKSSIAPDGGMSDSANRYLTASLPPGYQHDSSFVGTGYRDGTPQLSLMPLGSQGTPASNAAAISTAIIAVSSGSTTAGNTAILLETNGTPNPSQNILNLQAGANTTLVANSSGQVTISGTGGAPSSPLNSIQYNNAGTFGGTSLTFIPNQTPCVLLSGTGSCDVYDGPPANSVVISFVQPPDVSLTFGNVTQISNGTKTQMGIGGAAIYGGVQGANGNGTGVEGFSASIGTGSVSYGLFGYASDDPLDATTGQVLIGTASLISLTRAAGALAEINFFRAGPVGGIGAGAFTNEATGLTPGAETATNVYGLLVLDLTGKGTTTTAAVQINSQTCSGANCFAINVATGGGLTNLQAVAVSSVASLVTTAAASDNVTVTGATASSHCQLTATNASAATNIATTYISSKTTNQITVTHAVTSGMHYDIFCTAN